MKTTMWILLAVLLAAVSISALADELSANDPVASAQTPAPAGCDQATDSDCDGVPNTLDNCPLAFNTDQANNDGDTLGDVCDVDDDNDGVPDSGGGGASACPTTDTCSTSFRCTNTGVTCAQDSECTGGTLPDACLTAIGICALGGGGCATDTDCPPRPDVCRGLCVASAASCTTDAECTVSGCDDNCPFAANPDQIDTDMDGAGDVCDNCLTMPNPGQADTDLDGLGDACDPDADGDGIPTAGFGATCTVVPDVDGDPVGTTVNCNDNCPASYNPSQWDHDSDRVGTVCDNCVVESNGDQTDADNDGVGDVCDNCVTVGNAEQSNGPDDDAFGDLCDNCPGEANPTQGDADFDGAGDACDVCPLDFDPAAVDTDGDGLPDACDPCPAGDRDDDGDRICTANDNCPLVANPDQSDADADSRGDACDCDQDGDGVDDKHAYTQSGNNVVFCTQDLLCYLQLDAAIQSSATRFFEYPSCGNDTTLTNGNDVVPVHWLPPCCLDNCPSTQNTTQVNADTDVAGAACDPNDGDPSVPTELPALFDPDFDGVADVNDNCPGVFNADQSNVDLDELGDACDDDIDGDLSDNGVDNCPGTLNMAQLDSDLDGLGDVCDNCPFAANRQQDDRDADGVGNACDLADDFNQLLFHRRDSLSWQQELGFDGYIVVSGDLTQLRVTGEYVQAGGVVDCDPDAEWSVAAIQPDAGEAAFFVVGGDSDGFQNGFGRRDDGELRIATDVCP